MKIRIKFAKYGTMKFIGHLDMMRFFQKAIRRAGIDIKYSEGFSPHQIMSFAAPLGVGLESTGEYLDIEVNSMKNLCAEDFLHVNDDLLLDSQDKRQKIMTVGEMKDGLNRAMVEGVEVISVGVLPDTVKNAMASVAAASYRLHSKEGAFGIADLEQTVKDFYAQETIPYTKETKKSVIELDLKQGIYEITTEEIAVNPKSLKPFEYAECTEETELTDIPEQLEDKAMTTAIRITVNASSSGNIKPSMVFEKLCEFAGVEIPASAYQVTRLETYTDLAKEGETHQFVPLADCCLDTGN